jgi:hypothetical protein
MKKKKEYKPKEENIIKLKIYLNDISKLRDNSK